MKTNYFKALRGGYQAETMTETDANGHAWQITTMKRSNGLVSCSAIQGSDNGSGIFSYEMFGAKRLDLAKEKTNGTEAAIKRVHAAGLAEFEKVQAATPQITAPAYVVTVGQILFTDSCGQWDERKRVIYEVVSPGRFKTVTLDGQQLRHDDHVSPYNDKFGIGTYYNEGETLQLEEVNNLVNQARQATEEREAAEQRASEEAAKERARKIEEGSKILPAIPEGVKAVIMGIRFSTTYDPNADYQAHTDHTEEVIYLAFSGHEKDLFAEMRKAADKDERTAHMGTGKNEFNTHQLNGDGRYYEHGETFTTEAAAVDYVAAKNAEPQPEGFKWEYSENNIEHREKYSMGSGYYMKSGDWKVRKSNIDARSLTDLQIAAAEGRFFCNEQPATTTEAASFEKVEVPAGQVQIIEHPLRAHKILVVGDTKPIKDKLKSLGGWWNRFEIGWEFKRADLEKVTKALSQGQAPDPETIPEELTTEETEQIEEAPTPQEIAAQETAREIAEYKEEQANQSLAIAANYDTDEDYKTQRPRQLQENNVRTFDKLEDIEEAANNGEVISLYNLHELVNKPKATAADEETQPEKFNYEFYTGLKTNYNPITGQRKQEETIEARRIASDQRKAGQSNTALPAPQMFLSF